MISSDDFGKFIASKRKEFKISQVALAEKLNVDPKTLSKWENGTSYPDLESAHKIAELFNMSLTDILNEEFDSELIKENKIMTFNNVFIFILIALGIAFIILKNLSGLFVIFESTIFLSVAFMLNVISLIILITKNANKRKLLKIFAKVIYAITILVLFIL